MNNLRETQHKRVVALAVSTLVFCLFSIWQLSDQIFTVGWNFGFNLTNREIYLLSACTLIMMAVVVILVRSFEDNAKIRFYEYHDRITGLPNAVNIKGVINRHLAQNGKKGALLMIDLSRLKAINNSMGSEMGDEAIAAYGGRLRYLFEKPNMVAKLHGGAFGVFMPEVETEETVRQVVNELLRAVAVPIPVMNRAMFLSIDMGACFLRDTDSSASQLLQRAELAMLETRKDGDWKLLFYTEALGKKVREQSRLETDLHDVLEREGLEPYFQPLVAEDGETVLGFEALARWNHPIAGFIAPTSFVPVAESLNLTEKLGRQIMMKACREIAKLKGKKVSVNVSAHDFRRPGFVEEVLAILRETGLEPERLEIELTESIFITDQETVGERIADLRAAGVSVALDDFGTGYSGLAYLSRFRVDRIKIDAEFVREIETSHSARSMISTIIGMAKERGYGITVEGVETVAQFEFLKRFPGLVYQGYLFAKPMQFADLEESRFVKHEDYVSVADRVVHATRQNLKVA